MTTVKNGMEISKNKQDAGDGSIDVLRMTQYMRQADSVLSCKRASRGGHMAVAAGSVVFLSASVGQGAIIYHANVNQAFGYGLPAFTLQTDSNLNVGKFYGKDPGAGAGGFLVDRAPPGNGMSVMCAYNAGRDYISRLSASANISAGAGNFWDSDAYFYMEVFSGNGEWANNGDTGYMGLRFLIGGETHYGWVQVRRDSKTTGTLIDWAYNDVANQSVKAGSTTSPVPEPSGLALLACGAAGIYALRKKRDTGESE